jgi:hypothetical protein
MENFSAIALFVATLYAFQNVLRYAKAKDLNGLLGILVAAASGVAVVALGAHADVTSSLHMITQGPALGALNGASQVMLGVAVGSTGTVLADARKAFDNTSSAAKPPLVG